MYKLIKWCRCVTIAFMLLAGSLALAEGKPTAHGKSPDKEKGENKGRTSEVNPGNDEKGGQMHSDMNKDKSMSRKKGNPPGWSHGAKEGWKGAGMPPGLARKNPPGWQKWDNEKKKSWEEQLGEALGNIRQRTKNKKGFSKEDLDSALLSIEAAAREGVPVESAREIIELSIKYGLQGNALETLSRATSSGVGKDIDFDQLNNFVEKKLDDGLRDDELLDEVYKEIDDHDDHDDQDDK